MEHYGLVRDKSHPVAPRHSWNTNKKISSWSMFNLSRHSEHHAQGHIPFYQLKPYEDAPMMLNSYLGTISLTLIPPLWFKLMKPKLQHWDQVYATEKN
jgi:fatty acid desaturase|tara:strand:- start:190 stop:483 length:294 start_codon:yes stop_codon:yes gene_type:complete